MDNPSYIEETQLNEPKKENLNDLKEENKTNNVEFKKTESNQDIENEYKVLPEQFSLASMLLTRSSSQPTIPKLHARNKTVSESRARTDSVLQNVTKQDNHQIIRMSSGELSDILRSKNSLTTDAPFGINAEPITPVFERVNLFSIFVFFCIFD